METMFEELGSEKSVQDAMSPDIPYPEEDARPKPKRGRKRQKSDDVLSDREDEPNTRKRGRPIVS